jgi:hypothetical protein
MNVHYKSILIEVIVELNRGTNVFDPGGFAFLLGMVKKKFVEKTAQKGV